jgi:hypothetical protein
MHDPHTETAVLAGGGTALLFTDGLVEERRVFLDVNLEKLRVAAQEVRAADVEAFANHLMAIFGPREDDVAMIALRRIPGAPGDASQGGAIPDDADQGGANRGGASQGSAIPDGPGSGR